jgi:hypothetical protein
MAKNNLTPEQDLLVREFFVEVAEKFESLQPDAGAYGRQLRAICLLLLNYDQLPNGSFVTKGTPIAREYGTRDYDDYPDEWQADFAAAVAKVATLEGRVEYEEEQNNEVEAEDTSETSTSEPSENTSVWKTILSKDV